MLTTRSIETVELPKLKGPAAELVRRGSWSLYRLPDGSFVLQTPQQNTCCNRKPQKTWHLDAAGAATGADLNELPEGAVFVRLAEEIT